MMPATRARSAGLSRQRRRFYQDRCRNLDLDRPLTYPGNTDIQNGMLQLAEPGAVTLTTITGDAGTLAVRGSTSLTATSIRVDTLTVGGPITGAPAGHPPPCPSPLR